MRFTNLVATLSLLSVLLASGVRAETVYVDDLASLKDAVTVGNRTIEITTPEIVLDEQLRIEESNINLEGEGAVLRGFGLRVEGTAVSPVVNVSINDLTIEDAAGKGVRIMDHTRQIALYGVSIIGAAGDAIEVKGEPQHVYTSVPRDIWILDGEIRDAGTNGIELRNTQDVLIKRVSIRDSGKDGIQLSENVRNVRITRVSVARSGDGNIDITRADNCDLEETKEIVEECVCDDAGTPDIVEECNIKNVEVRGSLFADAVPGSCPSDEDDCGDQRNSLLGNLASNIRFYENLLIDSNQRNPEISFDQNSKNGFLLDNNTTVDFRNNVVWNWHVVHDPDPNAVPDDDGTRGTRVEFGARANIIGNYYGTATDEELTDALVVCHSGVSPGHVDWDSDCDRTEAAQRTALARVIDNVVHDGDSVSLNTIRNTQDDAFRVAEWEIPSRLACGAAHQVSLFAGTGAADERVWLDKIEHCDPKPDLVPSTYRVEWRSPSDVDDGIYPWVTVSIANQGTAAATAPIEVTVKWGPRDALPQDLQVLYDSSDYLGLSGTLVNIPLGGYLTQARLVWVDENRKIAAGPTVGEHKIEICVDSGDAVVESDEGNNCVFVNGFYAGGQWGVAASDLYFGSIELERTLNREPDRLPLDLEVHNRGTLPVDDVTVTGNVGGHERTDTNDVSDTDNRAFRFGPPRAHFNVGLLTYQACHDADDQPHLDNNCIDGTVVILGAPEGE